MVETRASSRITGDGDGRRAAAVDARDPDGGAQPS
jgi:hypothetical protein